MAKHRYSFSQIASGIIVPALVLAAALGAYLILLPKYKAIKEIKGRVREKNAIASDISGNFAGIKKLIASVEDEQEVLGVLDQTLPTAPAIPELLSNLDNLAKQSGLLVANLTLTPARNLGTAQSGQEAAKLRRAQEITSLTDSVVITEMAVTLTGRYPNIKNFLLNLEKNMRLMDIESLAFGEVDKDSGLQLYTVKIHTYHQNE